MQQEPPFVVAIVDDDAGFRDAIGWLLKANGYGVRSYGDAPSFLNGHDPVVIGCVLLDLRLDDSCGIDTLVEARQRGLDAPVLMISGHGDIPIAALFALYAVSAFIWRGHGERQEQAEIAAKKEFSELVQSRCAAANRQYEDALLTRENYGSLSVTQQSRMGREWGADGNWVQDQVTQGRRALGDCEQRLMADKAAIYRSHGLSLEK